MDPSNSESTAKIFDREHHVIDAAHHLVKALQLTKNLSNGSRRLLRDLDIHLIDTKLVSAHRTITSLHSNHLRIWDADPEIVSEYLQAVAEVQRLTVTLQNMAPLNMTGTITQLSDRAQTTLQMAMVRQQDELIHILVQNKYCFWACKESPVCEDDLVENSSQKECTSSETEQYMMTDLIHPDVIPRIKTIANIMFASGYNQEFCLAFTAFWRDALFEYMTVLGVERFGVEEVLQMEWKFLNSRIRKWGVALKSIICVYLVSAKWMFDQILGDYGQLNNSTCLAEASKAPLLCLLNFGQAVSIGPRKPEWLFCLLDMYEVVEALLPDVDALFPEEAASFVRTEFYDLFTRLGDSAKAIWKDIGSHIASCSSSKPFANGGIHPLTKYVINYILFFEEYKDTLHLLLQGRDREGSDEEQDGPNMSRAMATHLQSLTSMLEANLEHKSKLYRDCSLKHIFMINNIHYMVQKIRNNSKIRPFFGDEWIRNQVRKFRQQAMYYERVTWKPVLTLLRDDGEVGKATLKERSRAFALAFESIYKIQTRWFVPDFELREDLRISASMTVIHAYRNFVSKVNNSIGEKYIKYTEQELGTYILDLLEGSPKSLSHSSKR